jgi:hypothetical protein
MRLIGWSAILACKHMSHVGFWIDSIQFGGSEQTAHRCRPPAADVDDNSALRFGERALINQLLVG